LNEGAAGEHPPRALFWAGAVVGWSVMAFGVGGLFEDSARTHPGRWIRWFLGALLVHDLLLVPAVFALGALLTRLAPSWLRAPLQRALIATGIVALIAFPFVGGFGRRSDNPSLLPNNYALGLVITLAAVWAATALVTAAARRRCA
ncbi:MAG: hypothetical protein ABR529_02660, partial [Actinomycetota bacterium]